jgi:hypothetical protein
MDDDEVYDLYSQIMRASVETEINARRGQLSYIELDNRDYGYEEAWNWLTESMEKTYDKSKRKKYRSNTGEYRIIRI